MALGRGSKSGTLVCQEFLGSMENLADRSLPFLDDLGDFSLSSQAVTINESPPAGSIISANQDVFVAAINTLNVFTVAGAIGASLGGGTRERTFKMCMIYYN